MILFDPLGKTINLWASCAIAWSEKDPSLAKVFRWNMLSQFSRCFLRQFLSARFLRTELVMACARQFFPDFADSEAIDYESGFWPTAPEKPKKHFLCLLMLAFGRIDPGLGDLVIAAGIEQARELGCLRYFEKLLIVELGRTPAEVKRLKADAASMLSNAETNSFVTLIQLAKNP